MTVKTIAKVKPAFPFEAYSHVVSPISAADGGGFMFTTSPPWCKKSTKKLAKACRPPTCKSNWPCKTFGWIRS